jgi:hypothetical protein
LYHTLSLLLDWQEKVSPAFVVAQTLLPVAAIAPTPIVIAASQVSLVTAPAQRFGTHEPPAVKVPVHPTAVTSVQQPVVAQQAPRRGVQGLAGEQGVPTPMNVWVAPAQALASVKVQVPVLLQHAPVFGQRLTPQTVAAPWNVLVVVEQPFVVVVVQAPVVLLQQAPSRAVHGLVGAQTMPAPRKVLVPVQLAASTRVHVPVPLQHAPVSAHRFTPHTVPAPPNVLVVVEQPATVVLVHAPVVVLQHVPSKAVQGFVGVQVVPTPRWVLVPVQFAGSTTEQVPVPLQHAPTPGHGLVKTHDVPTPWNVLVVVEHEA